MATFDDAEQAIREAGMDPADPPRSTNTERIAALIDKPLVDLTVGEMIFLMLALDDTDDDVMANLIGYEPDPE